MVKKLLCHHHFQRIPTTLYEKKTNKPPTHLSRSSPCFFPGADLMSNSKASSSFRSSAIARTCRGTAPTKNDHGDLIAVSKRHRKHQPIVASEPQAITRSSAKHGVELEPPHAIAFSHLPLAGGQKSASRLSFCTPKSVPRARSAFLDILLSHNGATRYNCSYP